MKKEKGYLTVEATLTLTAFLSFILFIMNMGQVYRAQNYVTHGLLQTGKALAFESYQYKKASGMENFIHQLGVWMNLADDKTNVQVDWKNENYTSAVQKAFGCCIGGTQENADETLKRLGIENGTASVDFSDTKKEGNDLEIHAKYDVQLPFAFFGFDHVTLRSFVVCGVWE